MSFPIGHPWAAPYPAPGAQANALARQMPQNMQAAQHLGAEQRSYLDAAGVTYQLPALGTGVNHITQTLEEVVLYSSGSVAGQSAISDWLSCPEYSRLRKLGVRTKASVAQMRGAIEDLDPASFGTMMHALRAMRYLHGEGVVYWLLERWRSEMTEEDYLKAKMMWHIYDTQYMFGTDPFEFLGIEVEVRSALPLWNGGFTMRSCRYDTVIRYLATGEIASFEFKTMSRNGRSALLPYYKQGASQMAIWNHNPYLVALYGPMGEVLYDCAIKTKTPDVMRVPERFSRVHQALATKYLTSPEQGVIYKTGPDGRFPQHLTNCWGRWRACEYIDLCWHEAFGAYQMGPEGKEETYDGR